MLEAANKVFKHVLCVVAMRQSATGLDINGLEILRSQSGRCLLVELCDRVQHINGLLVATSADEEFWGLVEVKDKVSEEEDHESHATKNYDFIAPSHVVLDAAAWAASRVVAAGRK